MDDAGISTRRGVALGLVVGQAAVLYAPSAPPPPGALHSRGVPVDKVIHFVTFAAPTFALVRAGLPWRAAGLAMAGHAVVSELVQHHLMSGRSGEPGDVLANLSGVLGGLALAQRWP